MTPRLVRMASRFSDKADQTAHDPRLTTGYGFWLTASTSGTGVSPVCIGM